MVGCLLNINIISFSWCYRIPLSKAEIEGESCPNEVINQIGNRYLAHILPNRPRNSIYLISEHGISVNVVFRPCQRLRHLIQVVLQLGYGILHLFHTPK